MRVHVHIRKLLKVPALLLTFIRRASKLALRRIRHIIHSVRSEIMIIHRTKSQTSISRSLSPLHVGPTFAFATNRRNKHPRALIVRDKRIRPNISRVHDRCTVNHLVLQRRPAVSRIGSDRLILSNNIGQRNTRHSKVAS